MAARGTPSSAKRSGRCHLVCRAIPFVRDLHSIEDTLAPWIAAGVDVFKVQGRELSPARLFDLVSRVRGKLDAAIAAGGGAPERERGGGFRSAACGARKNLRRAEPAASGRKVVSVADAEAPREPGALHRRRASGRRLPGQRFPEVLRDGDRLPGGVDRSAGDLPFRGEEVLPLHGPEKGEPERRPLLLDPDDPGPQGEAGVEPPEGPVPALGRDHGEAETPPDVPVDAVGGKAPRAGELGT